MPPFISQAQPKYPDNADVSKQLMLLGDTIGKGISEYQKKSLLADVLKPGPDGSVDYGKATIGLLQMGEPQMASALANIAGAKEDRAFRQSEAQRSQSNADRSFGLQKAQLGATQANTAAQQNLQREQFEFNKIVKGQEFQLKLKEIDAKNQKLSNVLTPGQKAADDAFAKEYVTFRAAGGFSDVDKQLKQLDGVLKDLDAEKGFSGPAVGLLPDAIRSFTNPEAVAAKNKVEEVVQRNLRTILGAQFTQEEGKRLIERAYNPQLSDKENASRVRSLITQIRTMAQQKQAASDYFEQNGTIAGFKGQVSGITPPGAQGTGGAQLPPPPAGFEIIQ